MKKNEKKNGGCDKKYLKEKTYCHDCLMKINSGDEVYAYSFIDGRVYYKCSDCYKKNDKLENFQPCEVYSRIVGYIRPVDQWNPGKAEEFCDRQEFEVSEEGSC